MSPFGLFPFGDQRVGAVDGIVEGESAPAAVRLGDDADAGAVHLMGEDEVAWGRAESGGQRRRFSSTQPGSSPTLRLRFSDSYGPHDTPPR